RSSQAGMRNPGSKISVSVATRPLASEDPPERESPVPVGDIRQGRPYFAARSTLRVLVLRLVSFVALIALDLTGVGLALYAALVISAVLIGLFRASYEVTTREALRSLGVRRRAILAGEGEHLVHLYRTLGLGRSGIDYEFVGAVAATPGEIGLPVLGQIEGLRG